MIEKPEIVIACKDAGITNKLAVSFEQVSARLYKPTSRKELLDVVRERFINLAIIDSRLFGVPELVVVKEIKSLSPSTEIILYMPTINPHLFSKAVEMKVFAFLDRFMFNPANIVLLSMRALESQYYRLLSQKRHEQVKSFLSFSEGIRPASDVKTVLRKIVREAMALSDCEFGQVLVLRENEILHRQFWNGVEWVENAWPFLYRPASSGAGGSATNLREQGIRFGDIVGENSLLELRTEFYRGFPIHDKRGTLIGLMELASKRKDSLLRSRKDDSMLLENLLRVAARTVESFLLTGDEDVLYGAESVDSYYRNYVENTSDLVFVVQNDRFTFVNKIAFDTLLYKKNEFYGFSVYDITASEYKESFQANLKKKLAGEIVPNYELVLLKRTGERVTLDVGSVLIRHAGKPAVLLIARNITEKHKSNLEALQLAAAIGSLNSAVTITDMDMNIEYVNPAHIKTFGYELEELIGKKSSMLYPFEDPFGISKKIYEAVLMVGWEGERLGVRKNGQVFPVYEKTSIVKDKEGNPKGIVSIVEDISLRKRLEQALRESEERYRTLVDTASSAIIAVDEAGNVKLFNPAASEIFGYKKEEILGKSVSALVPERYREALEGGFANFVENKMPALTGHSFEFRGRRKNGAEFPIEVSLSSCKIGGQRVFTAIILDITERKQLQEKLIQSEKMAAIGQLISGVTHEVNNPLAVVMGYSELLLMEEKLDEEVRSYIQVIYEQAQKSREVIQDLLSFARVHDRERKPVNINDVMKKTLALKEYDFKKHNIDVTFLPDSSLPATLADPNQLQQVFLNLIINAEHAMMDRHGDHGSKLVIETKATRGPSGKDGKPNKFIEIYVIDNGCGIKEEYIGRIFDPFFTTKPEGKGTGLGLSVSYGIIKDHDGELTAFNNESGGATFLIRLPVVEGGDTPEAERPTTAVTQVGI